VRSLGRPPPPPPPAPRRSASSTSARPSTPAAPVTRTRSPDSHRSSASLAAKPASLDRQRDAVDGGGRGGGEEHHRAREVGWLAPPPCRQPGEDPASLRGAVRGCAEPAPEAQYRGDGVDLSRPTGHHQRSGERLREPEPDPAA